DFHVTGVQTCALPISGRGHVVVPQEEHERIAIDLRCESREREQRFQLGAEEQRLVGPSVVQRFLADTIARKVQHAFGLVPNGKCKHAVCTLERSLETPSIETREQYLGIGMSAKAMAK